MMSNRFVRNLSAIFIILFFTSCSLPQSELSDVMKILDIRESKLNSGDINSVGLLISDSFPDRKNYLSQLNLQQQYFTKYTYSMNTTKILGSSFFPRKIDIEVDYDLSYSAPEDPEQTYFIGKKEQISLFKEKIGWKITDIRPVEDSGRKIAAQTVHDIFFALETRKNALNNGDVELFKTVIDSSYKGRDELIDNFRKNSEAFINVNYGLKGREFQYISPEMDSARVVQYYDLVFKIKGLEKSEKVEDQKEIIFLKRNETGVWTITEGL